MIQKPVMPYSRKKCQGHHPTQKECGIVGRGASAQRSGGGPQGGRAGAVEAGHWLPSTLESRDSNVPRQAAHRRQAKPEKLQRAGRRGLGVGEGHQQDDRAWHACTAAGQLSETGAWRKSARTASELCNKATKVA